MVCQIFLYAQRASFWPSPSCRCARLPSQALRASSPTGRAKCTAVNSGKVYGKANSKSGPSCCMVTVKGAVFGLKPPRGRARRAQGVHLWAGGGFRYKQCGGQPYSRPPQRDPIFRDAKVLLFWCDQQQKELLVRYFLFAVTSDGCVPGQTGGLNAYLPLISGAVWCSALVISNVNYWWVEVRTTWIATKVTAGSAAPCRPAPLLFNQPFMELLTALV